MKTKHTSLVIISILFCLSLSACQYVDKIKTRLYLDNSKTEITIYEPSNIPVELRDILSRQTYPGIYFDEIKKNTYLLHDSRSIEQAFLHIEVSAKLINRVLYVNIRKFQNVDEADNNTPNELISVIEVPSDKYVYDIKITTEFRPYSPWIDNPH